jgi:hypothetical protein
MAQTFRQYWGSFEGQVGLNFNWSIINWDSVVLISASQYVEQDPPTTDFRKIVPSNFITVENIAPHGPPFDPNHGVSFDVVVNSPSPIPIVTDIIVLPAPVGINYPTSVTQKSTTPAILHAQAK